LQKIKKRLSKGGKKKLKGKEGQLHRKFAIGKKNSEPSTQKTITKMRRSREPKLLFDDQTRMKELPMVASCTQALHGRMGHK